MYDSILVVGNGKTSRANVEALIDDYLYANPDIEIFLYSVSALSEGQVWLKQYLEDKGVKHQIFLNGLTTTPLGNSAMFILWSDEDPESQNLLSVAKDYGIPAFDLTNGLVELSKGAEVVKPKEQPAPAPIVEPEPKVETTDLDELIDKLARQLARSFADELKKVLNA